MLQLFFLLLLWVLEGALVGWIASVIMGTSRTQGFGTNVLVGIIGSFLGGMLFGILGSHVGGLFWSRSLLSAVAGAVILLAIVRAVRGRPATA